MNAETTTEADQLVLCYVEPPWAWFTSRALEEQRGDDWDDAPYHLNAGRPYEYEGETVEKVAYDGPLFAPGEGPRTEYDGIGQSGVWGNFVAVDEMNHGDVPWLVETDYGDRYGQAGIEIDAGVSLAEFIELVREAGGTVYRPVEGD